MIEHRWPLTKLSNEQVAELQARLDALDLEEFERGRQLTAAGKFDHDSQRDAMAQVEYWCSQRESVGRRGYCDGGCSASKLVVNPWCGEVSCRQAWQPCRALRLRAIAELWSRVNGQLLQG